MDRYILVLLVLNSSYRSLGFPLNSTVSVSLANMNSLTAKDLTALANRCENEFLSNQIKNQIAYCSDLSSPHSEKQLQCLIFYDISMQLCTASSEGKISLPEKDNEAKINEAKDVNSLCTTAKDWVFSNIPEFPHYKPAVDKVFKHFLTCGKICSVFDFTREEANYFCKYFQWGTDVLNQLVTVTSTQQNAKLSPKPENVVIKPVDTASGNSDLQDLQIKDISSTVTKLNTTTSNAPVKISEVAKVDPDTSTLEANKKIHFVNPESLSNVAAGPQTQLGMVSNVDIEDTRAMPENVININSPSKSPEDIAPKAETVQKAESEPGTLEEPDPQKKPDDSEKTDGEKELQLLNSELYNKQPVLETPKGKQPNEVEDYPDSEEGKEGLSDMQGGDDGDDPVLGDLDTKPEEQKPAKKAATVVSTYTGAKETFYADPMQDAYPQDDDHFFPFFLTAIILVVLLYVLYHNKNKVSKVFFGLILEGRQASRRRNSRGHSYRRLDTLEQAMGASTTAPPSKIIY